MKKENLYDAIQNIDDTFITEAASVPVQPCRRKPTNLWLKVASIAACFMAVVLLTSTLLRNNNVYYDPGKDNPINESPISEPPPDDNVGHDDPTLEEQIFVNFDNISYWVIGRNYMDRSNAKNLPAQITDDLIGEYLGEGIIAWREHEPEIKVPVYACTVSNGQYLRIVYYNGQYLYMQHANFIDDTILTPRKLAEMLVINDSSEIAKITVKKLNEREAKEIEDSSKIKEFWDAFMSAECIDIDEYEDRIYGDKSEEERQMLGEKMASNGYIITMYFQNGIQYEMTSDEYKGVHYLCFISCYVVMPDEFNNLIT